MLMARPGPAGPDRAQPDQTGPSRTRPGPAGPDQAGPGPAEEIGQYPFVQDLLSGLDHIFGYEALALQRGWCAL